MSDKVKAMENKTSAHYQRLHRQRLREQGLVKKEVWILPAYSAALSLLEKQMRQPAAQPSSMAINRQEITMESSTHSPHIGYRHVHELADALRQTPQVQAGRLRIEVLDGADASVLATVPEFGDLPVHLALSGEQLVVEAFLWGTEDVRDKAGLNEQILRLQKLFPFTTMALEPRAHNHEAYVMFAAMRTSSASDDIVAEILTLADSVIQVTEALTPYLAPTQAHA